LQSLIDRPELAARVLGRHDPLPPKLPRLGAPLPTASSLCTHRATAAKPPPPLVVGRAVVEAAALCQHKATGKGYGI
jgi:hypothetical protein